MTYALVLGRRALREAIRTPEVLVPALFIPLFFLVVNVGQAATARITVVDGDITAGHLGGDAQLRTARGSIRITEATRGTLQLRTQTGAITVGAAAGTSAALDAGTTIGRVRNALKNTGTTELAIHATTTVGDITASSL